MSILETALNTVTGALRDCVRDALAATDAGTPDRVCNVPGLLAWDDCECGVLAVTVDRIYQSATFPNPASDQQLADVQCSVPYLAVDMTVTVLRCAPSPQGRELAPSCDTLAAAALSWFVDMDTVRAALGCCLADLYSADTVLGFALRDTTPAGPDGGCVGSETHLTVGVVNCLCPA
jgi:hypothetical protein